MQQVLLEKLHQYLINNNVDLLIALQQENKVGSYLKDKVDSVGPLVEELLAENTPAYIIQERCMDELTTDLRPSKFNYLISILEEEFEEESSRLKENGPHAYELINLIEVCKPVFENLGFAEDAEDDQHLRYAIIDAVKGYLENKQ
jgi:hypothetical protein